jgi:hypothetical protein
MCTGVVRLWCARCLVCCSQETTLTFHLFDSFVRCKKRHAPTHVEIVSGLVVGTLAAASTTISAVSTSRDGLVESATGSSTIRRVQVFEGRSIQSNLSSNLEQC